MKETAQKTESTQHPRMKWGIILWIAASFVFAYLLFQTFTPEANVDLSYSEFKKQVKKGNVSDITIRSQEIRGHFKKPYSVTSSDETKPTSYSSFTTIKPALEDPGLMTTLEDNEVTVRARKEGGSWLSSILIIALPWILIIGYFVYAQKNGETNERAGTGRPFRHRKIPGKTFQKIEE